MVLAVLARSLHTGKDAGILMHYVSDGQASLRESTMRRRASVDSDADPHDARNDLHDESASSVEESSSPVDEYDLELYLADELRRESLKLTSFLGRLQGARFGECSRILLESQVRHCLCFMRTRRSIHQCAARRASLERSKGQT